MRVFEQDFPIPPFERLPPFSQSEKVCLAPTLLDACKVDCKHRERIGDSPTINPVGRACVRFAITQKGPHGYHCEAAYVEKVSGKIADVFEFRQRTVEHPATFNVALVIPTGIGAELGGHAGDAGPVARLIGEVADAVVLHPNVVNGSDINEMPANALYVEGSVLSRLLMGTVGLQRVRSNRVLVVIDAHPDALFVNAAVNAVNGARASYGLNCPEIVCLDPPVKMSACSAASGRAAGEITNLGGLCDVLDKRKGQFDAVALSSVISVSPELHQGYFDSMGDIVNPWGGVEAMLTHTVSSLYNVPTAHAPMFESREIANADPGTVDPRMAAEAVSLTFLQCVLKGLQRAPRIVDMPGFRPECFKVEDVSAVVIPDGCLGLPTLAALEQGITVVAVENRNLMRNDLRELPWSIGQFHQVKNYWEAVGLLAALRAGIEPASTRRPLSAVGVSRSNPTLHREAVMILEEQSEGTTSA